MAKIQITTLLHMQAPAYGETEPTFRLYPFDMSRHGCALIGERTVEVDVPEEFDPKPALINALREEQAEIRAEAQGKVNRIEERIQSLLCLENKAVG